MRNLILSANRRWTRRSRSGRGEQIDRVPWHPRASRKSSPGHVRAWGRWREEGIGGVDGRQAGVSELLKVGRLAQ